MVLLTMSSKLPEVTSTFLHKPSAYHVKDKSEILASQEARQLQNKQVKPKRRYTPGQEEYQAWQRTFARTSSSSSRAGFTEAAPAWQVERARRVADQASLFI